MDFPLVRTMPMSSFETWGSNSWTSRPAESRCPDFSAATSAASSITGPRAVLIILDPGFIAARNAESIR